MKKSIKITIIVVPIILVALIAPIVGTLLYTKNNVIQTVGEPTLDSYILPTFDSFLGYIVVSIPVNITNNGLYDLIDIEISLIVYGQDFLVSQLNGIILGEGTNLIGNVLKGETWVGELELNMTSNIAYLAVQDGEMEIHVDISLKLDFFLFKIRNSSTDIQTEIWDSPFGI